MEWNKLEDEATLEQLKAVSYEQPIVIFKHSTRCSISSMALSRLERSWKQEEMEKVTPYFIDLLSFRNISLKTAETFNIPHESPQLLLIENGECIYDTSHSSIVYDDLKKVVEGVKQ